MRQFGSLACAGPRLTRGGYGGSDDEAQAAWYVEHTDGFESAKPVLLWVFSQMHRVEDFRVVAPGEEYSAELLLRRGWGYAMGRPKSVVAGLVLHQFRNQLADRLRREPFVPIREDEPEEMTPDQIDAANRSRSLRDMAS